MPEANATADEVSQWQKNVSNALSPPSRMPLTSDMVISAAGIYDMTSAKELILRDEGIDWIDEQCAQNLVSLEILSLSHNKLTSLDHFQYFTHLIELNLNFNRISSIDNLQCIELEKLFLANNRVSDITPLKAFSKLTTLSLYGNQICDLSACLHVCRSLAKLRSLDLGGNPCSSGDHVQEYKFEVIRLLPRLKELDGDQITQLDKDLTEEYVTQKHSKRRGVVRPFTAPVPTNTTIDRNAQFWGKNAQSAGSAKGSLLQRGPVRLFRDDFLNNHPIMLEYLAQDVHETAQVDTETVVHDAKTKFQDTHDDETIEALEAAAARSGKGFVEKMRSSNPLPRGMDDPQIETEDGGQQRKQAFVSPASTPRRPPTAAGMAGTSSSHLEVDPSDPKMTIRKLLQHIEVLNETLASYRDRQLEARNEALREEISRLQIENNNIPILQDQIKALKIQADMAPTSTNATADQSRIQALEAENAMLKRENEKLRASMLECRSSKASASSSATERTQAVSIEVDESDGDTIGELTTRRLADDAELLEESAVLDMELTELILQNEVSLEMIRHEINSTKKEWEMEFQRAKQLEQEKVRPATSMGIVKSNTSTPSSTKSGEIGSRSRHLHTSAGFIMKDGPKAGLLRDVSRIHATAPTHRQEARMSSSMADILTL
ncbi:TPA: hypothetical protein N0F65_007774 [Lagenidium giganteum]|uniref:Uncharacterized protein n=1 Tax=Lagenidium giganteum TaxID=4803 RepID=A0AAV2YQ54_9STRA|nr:TPA: hypothetical protein N0F65_007774 [Lagenidium giganteum]